MVVLGGLISEQTDLLQEACPAHREKIPYLGDVLGADTATAKTRTELVAFLETKRHS